MKATVKPINLPPVRTYAGGTKKQYSDAPVKLKDLPGYELGRVNWKALRVETEGRDDY